MFVNHVPVESHTSHLHDACVVSDKRHQNARARLVKEIHRVAEHLAEELTADISDDLVTHPPRAIGASVGTEATQSHDHRNGKADQHDRIDFWACIEGMKI